MKMKKTSKIIALVTVIVMLAGMAALTAAAAGDEAITVSLRIEGFDETLYYKQMESAEGTTLTELLAAVGKMEDAPEIAIKEASFGSYVSEVNGLAEFAHGGMSGWNYRVNDESPVVGIDEFVVKDGDEIVLFYGDPYGVGMQYPIADLSRVLSDGIIAFTSRDTTYDEDWNPILEENPVADATVVLDGVTYLTDANGEIVVNSKTGIAGFHKLQIERFDDGDEGTGMPTVLRLAPDHVMYIQFADTPDEAWFDIAVMFCVGEGYFVGANPAENLFLPLDKMNMVQLFTVLARIGGVDAALTTGARWFEAPLEWAVENELLIMPEDEEAAWETDDIIGEAFALLSNMTVARENFIYLFYRTAALVGSYDMTLRADITGAADYDDIYEDCVEAVSWAVAAGIIRGTSESGLAIEPGFEVNRATVCQMLLNYYSN